MMGIFARFVGDRVAADLIKLYIKYHANEIHSKQLKLYWGFKTCSVGAIFLLLLKISIQRHA